MTLDENTVEELQWWSDHLVTWNRKDIIQPPPDIVLEMDVSLVGRGAVCDGEQTGCLWSREEQLEHINVLELMAGMFAVQALVILDW